MNNILLFGLISFAFSLFIYKCTKGEILGPSFLTTSTIGTSAILLYSLSTIWNIDFNSKTVIVLLYGFISLTLAELMAYAMYRHKPRIKQDTCISYKYIKIRYCNILLLIYFISSLLYFRDIYTIGKSIGYNDLTAIGEVKADIEELSSHMNPIVRQMYKVVTSACYIHSFIFAYNLFLANSNWKNEIKHLSPLVSVVIITLASGGRLNIFKSLMGAIFIIYMVLRESSRWKDHYIRKFIFTVIIPALISFCVIFSSVSLIVKSNASTREKKDALEYISYYAGGSLQVFNLKVEKGRKRWSYDNWGYGTFSGIYSMFKIKDKNAKKIGNGMIPLGSNADYAGNAYTIFGVAYMDFGLFGMIIFIFGCYFLFCRYYYKYIINTFSTYRRNKKLVVYSYFFTSIIVMAFYDNCFWILFSSTGILTYLVLIILYHIYFKKLVIYKDIPHISI
jgi:oligosaccharide repeat unit polymerase